MKLELEDIQPKRCGFIISSDTTKTYVLKPFSLAARIWVKKKFGSIQKVEEIFKTHDMESLCEIVYYLLEDKTQIKDAAALTEAVLTINDEIAVHQALMQTLGLSEPVLDKLMKGQAEKKKPAAKTKRIGSKSST